MMTYDNLAAPATEIVCVIPQSQTGRRLKVVSARLSSVITARTVFLVA